MSYSINFFFVYYDNARFVKILFIPLFFYLFFSTIPHTTQLCKPTSTTLVLSEVLFTIADKKSLIRARKGLNRKRRRKIAGAGTEGVCVFLKSLDRFLLVILIGLSNIWCEGWGAGVCFLEIA